MVDAVAAKQLAATLSFEGAAPLVEFLEGMGATAVRHSRRTFLHHLVGTAALLERWGARADVCKAGLFHSVYGTEVFRQAVLPFDARASVRAKLGDDAERLAYLFCATDRASIAHAAQRGEPHELRDRTTGAPVAVSARELTDLVWINWANALEQAPRALLSPGARFHTKKALRRDEARLSAQAMADLVAFYGPYRTATGEPMATPGVRALLDVQSPESFLKDYWCERLYLAKGPVERLAGLVDYELPDLVAMRKHHTKAFLRTLDGKSTSIMVERGQERALYDAGFTLYFHNLASPAISEWIAALDEELGLVHGVTRVAAFASRRGLGLNPHYDQNDNFVCQARGMKRWRIAPNTHVKYPTIGYTIGSKPRVLHEVEAPDGLPDKMPEPYETIETRAGMVMYMPRGMWHDTETVAEESLHFNIQCGLPTWKDAIEFVLTQTSALYAEELRAPIQRLFEGERSREGFDEELKAKLKEAVDYICDSDIVLTRNSFHKFIMSRRPRS